jgi:hypothetical protein
VSQSQQVVVLTTVHLDGESIEDADVLTYNGAGKLAAIDTLADEAVPGVRQVGPHLDQRASATRAEHDDVLGHVMQSRPARRRIDVSRAGRGPAPFREAQPLVIRSADAPSAASHGPAWSTSSRAWSWFHRGCA